MDRGTSKDSVGSVVVVVFRQRSGPYGAPGRLVEDLPAISVETGSVEFLVALKPHEETLIWAASLIVDLARLVVPSIRARLGHFHDRPELARLAILFAEFVPIVEESHPDKIHRQRSFLHAFEYVDASFTLGADEIGSPDGHFMLGYIGRRSAF